MTDTKLEPELPQATFFITGEIGKPMIPAYTAEQVRAAIEADRNKRAPAVSLTDEQVIELAKNAGFYPDDSLAAEFPNGYAEVQRRTIAFARALLSSVAPRVPEGFVLIPKEPTGVMKDAGAYALPLAIGAQTWVAADVYRAMIAAAQQPKE